ncbi:unnamed protein product [Aureobasidium vineae]|uniref:Uncharacterized protein n=1 Tax=Aureobasidium vineae TaxID=2773715 RepID=A0A9N8JF89_9PEZI|nr:unnamed protein product [Aureobasidium vineae]
MANQYTTLSTQSPQDSFLSDSTVRHSKAIRPPRSQASRSQKQQPKPTTLTAEALAMLEPTNKIQTAAYYYNRIKDFINQLPAPGTSIEHDENSDAIQHPDLTTLAKETEGQTHYYMPPFHLQHMHIYHRFQKMRREEPWAEFHTHNAWLSLHYSEHGEVCMYAGVENVEHCDKINKHMTWLRDKWLGIEVGLVYYLMEYEDDGQVDKREVDVKGDEGKVDQKGATSGVRERSGSETEKLLDASTWSDFDVSWPV